MPNFICAEQRHAAIQVANLLEAGASLAAAHELDDLVARVRALREHIKDALADDRAAAIRKHSRAGE